ncbi:MAG TPA: dihydrolipoamide acetyltransferase family protein, partial [Flavobacteriaceae bacterium]|nr:dihydrolipoamide acetyltransferase family protein [Flavobacteriaceae bacterium]
MARYELKLPQMGESVAEATVTGWLKDIGDTIEEDEAVLEIATDKVDSEVPSEVEGILKEIIFDVDEVVKVGQTVAIIETDNEIETEEDEDLDSLEPSLTEDVEGVEETIAAGEATAGKAQDFSTTSRFYSPLVRSIAKEENIGIEELEKIDGTGKDGRVTKNDMLSYVENRDKTVEKRAQEPSAAPEPTTPSAAPIKVTEDDEIIEMTRMGKLVSKHMINSVQTSAHVQSFIEVDVTKIWEWRNKVKADFQKKYKQKITFTPIFMEAVAKTISDFPMINISVDGDRIIKHNRINLGMAAALPDGNLIVPVIKDADQLNLLGMTKQVNKLANEARNGKLKPGATDGGTYTVTNVGSFGSIMGTPIINQ